MNIGKNIKKFRNMRELTQDDLSMKTNISKNALWNYENDVRSPTVDVLQEIAEVLEVDPLVLLDDEYEPREETTQMSIKFILKNGCSFTTKCENFSVNKNGLGQVVGCNITGIKENKPIYVELDEIVAIVRKISDEEEI